MRSACRSGHRPLVSIFENTSSIYYSFFLWADLCSRCNNPCIDIYVAVCVSWGGSLTIDARADFFTRCGGGSEIFEKNWLNNDCLWNALNQSFSVMERNTGCFLTARWTGLGKSSMMAPRGFYLSTRRLWTQLAVQVAEFLHRRLKTALSYSIYYHHFLWAELYFILLYVMSVVYI